MFLQEVVNLYLEDPDSHWENDTTKDREGGSYGKVYHGFWKVDETNKIKAVKKAVDINLSSSDSSNYYLKTCFREIWNMYYARHPCIIKFLGWSTKHNEHEGILEFDVFQEEGDAILSKFEAKNEQELYIVSYGIVQGIKYMHELGILHRDLKPSNIMINGDKKPKIIDLGLSKVLPLGSQDTRPGTLDVGTKKYLPDKLSYQNHQITLDVFATTLILDELFNKFYKDKTQNYERWTKFSKQIKDDINRDEDKGSKHGISEIRNFLLNNKKDDWSDFSKYEKEILNEEVKSYGEIRGNDEFDKITKLLLGNEGVFREFVDEIKKDQNKFWVAFAYENGICVDKNEYIAYLLYDPGSFRKLIVKEKLGFAGNDDKAFYNFIESKTNERNEEALYAATRIFEKLDKESILKELDKNGYVDATIDLGCYYLKNLNQKNECLDLFQKAAKQGSAYAALMAGKVMLLYFSKQYDIKTIEEYFKQAVDGGIAEAQNYFKKPMQ